MIILLLLSDTRYHLHCCTFSANVTLIGVLYAFSKNIRQEEDIEWVRKLHE